MFFFNVVFVTVLSLLAATSMVSASSNDFPIPQEVARHLTNARRLAKGYPLKAPRHYHGHDDHHDHWHHGTHTREHRATPSAGPAPSAIQGCIGVSSAFDHIDLGYVSKNYNSDGSIRLTHNEIECLLVKLTAELLGGFPDLLVTMNGPDADRPVIGPISDDNDSYLTSLSDTDMRVIFKQDNQRFELYRNNALSGACIRNNMLLIDNCQADERVDLAFVQRT